MGRQDMRGFGGGWGGNAQLFWGAPPPVDKPIRNWPHLSVTFAAPAAETYEVILHYTSAPDFGTVRVFLDGQPRADIDAYSPAVTPQSRSLGEHELGPGNHELLVTVFGKASASKGFSVGLDRIELRPAMSAANPDRGGSQTRNPGAAASPQSLNPPGRPPSLAQLYFADISSELKWTQKGGTERSIEGGSPSANFVWESAFADKFAWRWQVALQPFSGPVSLSPPGLVAAHEVSGPTFTIDLASLPPLAGRSTSPQTTRQAQIDFYIRVIAIDGRQPVAAGSNVVVAHYLPGSHHTQDVITEGFKRAAEEKAKAEALQALNRIYSVEILSFKPAMFADPNRWGCVFIVKNSYASGPAFFYPIGTYGPGEHCGASYKGKGTTLTPWDYITGWAKTYEIVSKFYADAKAWTATQFANTLPCNMLGKAAAECHKYAEQLSGVALNVGLAAAGVPPTLPDLNAAAKGKAVEAAVSFTCASVESGGGQCSPELRTALAKAYGAGLDKLANQLDRTTKEPGCGDAAIAHENGREPLPCFGNYPGVEFRPADDAVYQPPMVTVRVTRTAPGPSDLAHSDYEIHAYLPLRNRFPGGQIESYYQPVPPTDLSGELFAPATLALPALGVGQSLTVVLPLGGIKQYTFSSTSGGYAVHNGWCALYNGGTGSVVVTVGCRSSSGALGPCAADTKRPVQMPKDYKCTIG